MTWSCASSVRTFSYLYFSHDHIISIQSFFSLLFLSLCLSNSFTTSISFSYFCYVLLYLFWIPKWYKWIARFFYKPTDENKKLCKKIPFSWKTIVFFFVSHYGKWYANKRRIFPLEDTLYNKGKCSAVCNSSMIKPNLIKFLNISWRYSQTQN